MIPASGGSSDFAAPGGRSAWLPTCRPPPSMNGVPSFLAKRQADGAGNYVPPPLKRRWFDGLLLVVEVLAVVGLAGILFNGFGLLRTLNQEVVSALRQEQDTPTSTPLITAVVLPSGHTPPSAAGGAQFNEAEIPEHLRPLVQSLANLPVPTPGPQQAIQIDIPAIGVQNWPIVQGDGWEQLKKGVGQHIGSVNPGENGNVVLAGHDDVFGEVFR